MGGEVLRMVFNVEPALRDTIGETLSTIASARVHDTLAALTSGNRDPGLQPQHLALAGSEMEHSHRIDILHARRQRGARDDGSVARGGAACGGGGYQPAPGAPDSLLRVSGPGPAGLLLHV